MGLAPRLDSLHVKRAAKAIAVGAFVQPAPLNNRFVGLSASRLGTVVLAVVTARIREEELAATAALTLFGPDAHRSRKRTSNSGPEKQNHPRGRTTKREE
jgi:hypothetical protein